MDDTDATPNQHWSPLIQLTLARLREFYREPAAVFWVYGFPLLLALLLGSAFRDRPIEHIRVDLVTDGPGGATVAEQYGEKLARESRLEVRLLGSEQARHRMRTAKTDLVLTPPATPTGAFHYLTEPNRPEAVLARNAVENVLLRQQLPEAPQPQESIITEPGSRYIDFLIPGLIGTNLMGGGLFGVGFLIVDLRVRKLLKRFLATPMRITDFMLSLILSRLLFTVIEIVILLAFARVLFGVQVQGDYLALAALLLAGGACFSGIGLLLACRVKTLETISGMMNAVMLPMYLLSGVFFSYERFPSEIQPLLQVLPLTTLIDGLRAVMNEGVGFTGIGWPVAILLLWGVGSSALAMKLFRWR